MSRACLTGVTALAAVTATVLGQSTPAFAARATTLYVSPDGQGTACSVAHPCSITEAKAKVRTLNSNMRADIVVQLAGGTYRLAVPLTFTRADSGTNGHRVVWQAAPGARPVISGAREATGWTRQDPTKNIWKAKVGTGFDIRQLYVDGVQATRARTQLDRADLTAGANGYTFTSGALKYLNSLADPGRTEIDALGSFTNRYSPVAGIRDGVITMKQPAWNNNTFGYDTITNPFRKGPLYIENAYEFLDSAGEWYLNTRTGTLYYKPLPGQDMSTADVEMPRLESLLSVGGTYQAPATHITFSGLQFSHTSWLQPSTGQGYANQQTGAFVHGDWQRPSDALDSCQYGCKLFEATRPHWHQMPAAVQVSAASHISFTGNRFTQLGQVALGIGNDANAHATEVGLGADTISVTGNVFSQGAGGGVVVGGVQADAHHPGDSRMTNRNITIGNNVMHDLALDYRDMTAVLVTYATNATVSHNEIYDMPYTGIAIGYGWGTNDPGGSQDYVNRGLYDFQPVHTTPTTLKNLRISGNYLHDVMRTMDDGACIYTLSAAPGTLIDRNYCADNNGHYGIYHDEGSRDYTDSNNVFRNTGDWDHENSNATNNTGALTVTDNWTSNGSISLSDGVRGNRVTGTVVVTDDNWPRGARQVMKNAGVHVR
ncbi:right-handed parallel beta-helix repeat-containing protein [Streptomyces phaeochromogenes]|uniref:right-handed parallel beta-helix repeat-containing protein n=1 Tax=Streptomyces phaeochromogenes TaxID=1923 RepID=UPI002DDC29B5|nr:right-handed parallel beta-helix repeat-containing protein [Streptomyces phaeochromogenes]WRZ34907.1 right-handed parallel beta-helix repeat-containing protein [Streptomyces phaeochromogenes]